MSDITSARSDRRCFPRLSYDWSVMRALLTLAAALFVGVSLVGCSSTPKTIPDASGTPATSESPGSVATSGSPVVEVTSVVAILEPYNPLKGKKGTPAELVSFTLSSVHQPLTCTIDVVHSGQLVASTVAEVGSPSKAAGSVTESVPVERVQGEHFPVPHRTPTWRVAPAEPASAGNRRPTSSRSAGMFLRDGSLNGRRGDSRRTPRP